MIRAGGVVKEGFLEEETGARPTLWLHSVVPMCYAGLGHRYRFRGALKLRKCCGPSLRKIIQN